MLQFTEYLTERENIFLSVPEVGQILRERGIYYQILTKLGIPYLFKTDKRTVFEYNKKGTTSDEDNTKSVFEKQPSKEKLNLTLAVLSRRVVNTGHSICFKNKHYRTINSVGTPIYFGKGTKCMVIEAFDKSLYATVEDSIFSLEEIPKIQLKSENFDEILPTESNKIHIPRMIHTFKRQSLEKFIKKQNLKM